MLKYLLAHSLQFAYDVVPLVLNDVQLGVNFIHLVIDVIVELLIEFIFNVLWQVVIEVLIRERWFWELSERIEVWSILETLNVHHIWELKVWLRRGHHWCRVHLSHVYIPELVDVIVCHLINLPDLTLSWNLAKLLRLGMRHKILLAWSHELFVHIVWCISLCLSMVNDILYALTQVFRISTAHGGGLLSSVKLLLYVNLLLVLLVFFLMLHLELTIAHQLVRYIYNGCRLIILPLYMSLHHIVIRWLIIILIVLVFIHTFLLSITLLLVIIRWILVVINIGWLHLLIIAIAFKWVRLMIHFLLRLVVALFWRLERGARSVDLRVVYFVDHLVQVGWRLCVLNLFVFGKLSHLSRFCSHWLLFCKSPALLLVVGKNLRRLCWLLNFLLIHVCWWLRCQWVSIIVECSLRWLLKVRLLFLLELNSTLAFLGSIRGIDFGIPVLLLDKGLAFEIGAALEALLTLLLREALHELIHQLSWVQVCFGFLAPTTATISVVAAFLGRLSWFDLLNWLGLSLF